MADEHLQALADPASPEQFHAALNDICRRAGHSHYLAIRLRGLNREEAVQVFQNAPAEASEQLQALRHWSVGRMVERMRDCRLPVFFGQGAEPGLELPGYLSGVAATARELRGACIVYFGSPEPAVDTANQMVATQFVVLASAYGVIGLAKLHKQNRPFSERELDCLRLAVEGLSAKQTAQRLNISPRTVEHYLENIRKRCGMESTTGAVWHAINQGWIDVTTDGNTVRVTG